MPKKTDPFIQVARQIRYQCPNCDTILEDGERRCGDCNRFGARVEGFPCPHCDEFILEESV